MKKTMTHFTLNWLGLAVISLGAISTLPAQTVIQQWNFNEANGTALNNTTNSVIGGGIWDRTIASAATNGAGSLVINGNYGASVRPVAPIATISGGIYQLDVIIAGWNLTGVTASDSPRFDIGLASTSASQVVANIAFDNADGTGFTLYGTSGGTGGLSTPIAEDQIISGGLVRSTPITLRLTANFNTFTYTISNSDTGFATLSNGTLPTDRIASFVSNRVIDNFSTTSTGLVVDSITLSSIPEPSTVALLGLAGGVWFFRYKSRRGSSLA